MKKSKFVKITAVFLALQVLSSCNVIKGIRGITDKNGKEINSLWAMSSEVPNVNDYKFTTGIVYGGNYAVVDEAIEDGSDINHLHLRLKDSITGLDTNAINFALMWKIDAMERYMVLKGADVNYRDPLIATTFLQGEAYNGNIAFCDLLLKHGAKIDLTDAKGNTALDCAAGGRDDERWQIATAAFLIRHGAKVTEKTLQASTEINKCLYGLQRFLLKKLLEEGKKSGLDPTLEAAMLGDSSKLNELVNAGKMRKEDENKILFFTASFGKVDTMKLLQSKGLSLQALDEKKNTLLVAASKNGNLEMVKYLVENGPDAKSLLEPGHDSMKDNVVTAAADNDHADVVEYYLQNLPEISFDYSKTDFYKKGPRLLYLAAENGDTKLIDFLLDKSFPFNSDSLSCAIDGAVSKIREEKYLPDVDSQLKVIQHLLDKAKERNVSCDLSFFLTYRTNLKTVKFFVEHGADVNGIHGKPNPISQALDEVDTDDGYNTIKYLVLKGANVNVHEFNSTTSETLLGLAVDKGRLDVIKLLVDHGANLEMQDERTLTPLQVAAPGGSRTVVEYLLKKGAKVDSQDNKGKTALIYAAQNGWVQNVKLLLKYGANKSIKGNDKKTAYDVAKSNNDKVMMGLLK